MLTLGITKMPRRRQQRFKRLPKSIHTSTCPKKRRYPTKQAPDLLSWMGYNHCIRRKPFLNSKYQTNLCTQMTLSRATRGTRRRELMMLVRRAPEQERISPLLRCHHPQLTLAWLAIEMIRTSTLRENPLGMDRTRTLEGWMESVDLVSAELGLWACVRRSSSPAACSTAMCRFATRLGRWLGLQRTRPTSTSIAPP